jgi:hypothetical protein
MAIYQELVDFNTMLAQLREPPIFINDLVNISEEEREKIRDMITTRYSSDMLSIMARCTCGETTGEAAASLGQRCPKCGTKVHSFVNEDIEPLIWFRKPATVRALINPMVWVILKNRFKKSGFSVIQWICDTTYRAAVKQPKVIVDIANLGIQRGYNNFVDNFDTIIKTLLTMKDFRVKKDQIDYVPRFLTDFRHMIFSDFIPLPNKSILVIEKTNVGTYIDKIIIGALDAINMITSIDSELVGHSAKVQENRTIKAIVKLSEFYEGFHRVVESGKPGTYRKHIFGSRTRFSFRAVVSSLTGNHKYDELHIPWFVAMTAYRPLLLNRLLRRGYEHNAAIGLMYGHVEKYHKTLHDIFNELLAEAHDACEVCIEQRNEIYST